MSTPEERIAARKAAVAKDIGFKRTEAAKRPMSNSGFKDAMKQVAAKPEIKLSEDFLKENTDDIGELKISPQLNKVVKKPIDNLIDRLKD